MEERIKYLFQLYVEDKCSRQEMEELFSYIQAAENDDLLRNLIKKVYAELDTTAPILPYVNEFGHLVVPDAAPEKSSKRRPVLLALATVIIVVISTVALIRQHHHPAPLLAASSTKKVTERSEYKYLLLPDSTQVWLNASSSLEFPDHFKTGSREVTLSGEAYFDVRHADKIPFIIHSGKVSTTVLGTAFNIKAYPGRDNVVVSVSSGKVKVSYNNIPVATLAGGQQVKVNNKDHTILGKKIAPEEVAAWQKGNMSYEDEDIQDIVADLERLYNVRIIIANKGLPGTKITTTFRREIGVEQALQVLCKLTDTMLTQADSCYVIQ